MMPVLVPGGDTTACLPIVESLTRKSIEVTVGSHKRICVGFFSRYPKHRELYPSPETHPEDSISKIIRLTKERGYEVIMPVGEFVSPLLARYRDSLPSWVKIPLPDWDTYLKARDKSKTMKEAMANGTPCPRTYFPEEQEMSSIEEDVGYPALVKPCVAHAARGISVVHSRNELEEAYRRTKEEYGDCIIQEYIPQTGQQYKAELVVNKAGEAKAGIVYAKLRYYPPSGGSSTLNLTVDRQDILETAQNMLKAIGWYGVADLDFIEDPRDSTPKLLEINPRFTRSIKIASIARLDFPYIVYKVALGEDVPSSCTDYERGMYLRFLPTDILWFLSSPERFKTKPSFFRFIDRNLRSELMSFKDPGPAVAFLVDGLFMLLNKQERRNILRLKKKALQEQDKK